MKKILLFAFRNSHKKFFEKLQKESDNYEIVATKSLFSFCFDGYKDIDKVNFKKAIKFAVDEFYAKTEIKIPRIVLNTFFAILGYMNYFRYYSVLKNRYSKMLVWNGGKFRQLIAIDIAKNIFGTEVYFFENGLLPNRIVLDPKGINYNNSVPREKEFFQKYHNNNPLPKQIVQRTGKHTDKFSVQNAPLPSKYIFVPFQVDYDTQIITNSHWIKNMRELFDLIEEVAKKSDIHFILKEHPSSGKNYPDLHKRAENISNIDFANGYLTQELIQNSQAVITINSTVGIESLLFHKKVIILGNAFYDIKGLTFRVKNNNELIKIVNNIEDIELDINLVDNFLKYLYYEYHVPKDEEVIYKEFNKRLNLNN